MNLLVLICALAMSPGAAESRIFGDIDHRNAAAVAADLNAVANLPTPQFDELARSVIAIVKTAKPTALALHAMDLVCAKCGPEGATDFASYLSECVDGLSTDVDQRKHVLIEALISADPARWGPAFRKSAATLALFRKIGQASERQLNLSLSELIVETLMTVSATDAQRRSSLLDMIDHRSVGAWAAPERIVQLLDSDTRQALRQMASAQPYNRFAVEALADGADSAALPILEDQRTQAQAGGDEKRTHVQFLDQAIRKINLLSPPTNLLTFIRSPGSEYDLYHWAIKKARDLNLEREQVRSAILDWAATAEPWRVPSVKERAIALGILGTGDLASASQPSMGRLIGHTPPERRTGTVEVPDRRPKADRWRPNQANYNTFFTWYSSQDRQTWTALSSEERERRFKQKLCELDLLSPEACEGVAASQPTP